ncbi:MAG: hypothetical protein IMW98_06435 [Firmicutes bacterium]|nr:hypothetical protein [Bacillota bacterium]
MVKRKRRRFPEEVYQAIYRMVREEGLTNAAQIHERLVQAFPDTAPTDRTVRAIVRELLPPDPSGPWQPGPDDDPEEAALVLEAWAETMARAKGRASWKLPSRERARWIAWIRSGWPDLDPVVAVVLATDYWARRASKQSTADLDAFLAFAPWRSEEAYSRLQEAIQQGRVPEPPQWYLVSSSVLLMQRAIDASRQSTEGGEQHGPAGSR